MNELISQDCTIIVSSFRPPRSIINHVTEVAKQANVVVVDDGSPAEFDDILRALETVPCELVRLNKNLGIAAALNVGIRAAIQAGSRFVVTFDQDSEVSDSHIVQCVSVLNAASNGGSLAAVGPGVVAGVGYGPRDLKSMRLDVSELLQSGMTVPVSVFKDIGLFEETLFIDGVDTEFCLRARANGYSVAVLPGLTMGHQLGLGAGASRYSFGPWQPVASGHSPLRRYYITRNRLTLIRRYTWSEPRWAAITLRRLIVGTILSVSVEKQKWQKGRAVCYGLLDALRGRLGVAPPVVQLGTSKRGA